MGTWIVGAIVVSAVALATRSVIKNRKTGGCAGCPQAGKCAVIRNNAMRVK